ncbi:MAG: aminotransferase class V-fold PLP-dependent enzyme [Methylobacteriaceae bacterium]|nr:aminotransferase class V-fold PLP-dependent enzyme [Methylobacteriaceae bacterium]
MTGARQALDVAALRAATPGTTTVAHFNHAGASLMSETTLAAITDHLRREALDGPHEAAAGVQDRLDAARADAATLVGGTPDEIAFTASGSAGWGLAFSGLPPLRAGDRVLVGRQEWGGNLATLRAASDRAGATVETIPCRADGSVDATALAGMIDARVRLVSLTWLPANGGLINDAAAVGGVTRAADVPYFVDAGQALGQLPVDVAAIGCDVLKGAGRKHLRGPRGTAILYVRRAFRDRLTPAFLDVLSGPWTPGGPAPRDDARAFETSEVAVALLLGLGAALRQALDLGIDALRARIAPLADGLRARLADVPGVRLEDLGTERSGLVAFTVAGHDAQGVRAALGAERINVGANGAAYTPLDMTARGLDGIVRASVHAFNTDEEIDRLVAAVTRVAAGRPVGAQRRVA